MTVSAARENLAEAVELARTEAVFLERYGQPAAVLISPERYEQLMAALEDTEDIATFDAAMQEEGPHIPWEQVKAESTCARRPHGHCKAGPVFASAESLTTGFSTPSPTTCSSWLS